MQSCRCILALLTCVPVVHNRYIHAELWNRDAMSSYTNGRQNTKNNLQGRADPMLMMANSRNPPDATYQTHQSDWIWEPDTTITDFEGLDMLETPAGLFQALTRLALVRCCPGYKLLRPYHHVSALVNGTASNSDPWYISISNIDIWMMHSFEYTVCDKHMR